MVTYLEEKGGLLFLFYCLVIFKVFKLVSAITNGHDGFKKPGGSTRGPKKGHGGKK